MRGGRILRWHEMTIYTREEAVELIAHFIHELGAGGVAIEESGTLNKPRDTRFGEWYELPLNDIPEGEAVIKSYFPEETDIDALVSQLRQSIDRSRDAGIDPGKVRISLGKVDEAEWADAWKNYFKPVHISERLVVKPTWEPYKPKQGETVIELDPGMAFGTGTHATTALCMRELERIIGGGEEVIDVGTGSGILAVTAAKLGARAVLALDLDPVAVSSASENVRLNGLQHRIAVHQSDLLKIVRDHSEAKRSAEKDALNVKLPVDVVVANILAEIILRFTDDVYAVLKPGGYFVASGITGNKEAGVIAAFESAGFAVEQVRRDQDWVAITARKR